MKFKNWEFYNIGIFIFVLCVDVILFGWIGFLMKDFDDLIYCEDGEVFLFEFDEYVYVLS